MAGISRVVILDQDSKTRQEWFTYFTGEGVLNVKEFSDGNSFWGAIESSALPPDVLVLDWSIHDVSSIALFNRIRSHASTLFAPLVVTSNKLKDDEVALLKEFPGTCFLPKPFDRQQLAKAVKKCRDESFWIKENIAVLDHVFLDLRSGKNDVKDRFFSVLKNSPNKYPLVVLATRILRRMKHHRLAHQILNESLKAFPNEPTLLTELAKICFTEGRLEDAFQLSDKAIRISPKNLERLCFNGEVSIGLGKIEEAEKRFRQALEIDSSNSIAVAGKNLETIPDKMQFVEAIKENSTPLNLASMLNLAGIFSIRNGDFEAGFKHYRLALTIVQSSEESSAISFNLGLGHLRAKRFDDAETWFKKCAHIPGRLKGKSMQYQEKLALRSHSKMKSKWNPNLDVDIFEEFEEVRLTLGGSSSERILST